MPHFTDATLLAMWDWAVQHRNYRAICEYEFTFRLAKVTWMKFMKKYIMPYYATDSALLTSKSVLEPEPTHVLYLS